MATLVAIRMMDKRVVNKLAHHSLVHLRKSAATRFYNVQVRTSVEGSRREPRRHARMGTPKGCFGADDKVVLANTGREAYAG